MYHWSSGNGREIQNLVFFTIQVIHTCTNWVKDLVIGSGEEDIKGRQMTDDGRRGSHLERWVTLAPDVGLDNVDL